MNIGTGFLGSELNLLGGLGSSALRSVLSIASWRGVTFYMPEAREESGRRVVQFFFPGIDDFKAQDFGAFTGPISVRGIMIGDDYVIRANRMREALMKRGPAMLVHPWLGAIRCRLLQPASIQFSETELRFARFEAVFVREPLPKKKGGLFSKITDTLTNLLEKADALLDQGILCVQQLLSPLAIPLALAGAVKDVVGVGFGVWDALVGAAPEPVQSASQSSLAALSSGVDMPAANTDATYANAVSSALVGVPAAIAGVVASTQTPAIAPASLVANGAQTTIDATIASALLVNGAAQIGTAATAAAATSLAPAAVLALGMLARAMTMAQAIAAQVSATYASQQDALAARDRMLAALDALEADITAAVNAGAPIFVSGLYGAVRDVRAALVADISARMGRLPKVVSVAVPQQVSAWLVAYALAGDTPDNVPALWDDLVSRNRLSHPGLAGPGALDVLEPSS
jgi:prophage DNA circulation protein